jgi:hypothetical protein
MAWRVETRDDVDLIGGWAFVPGDADVHDETVSAGGVVPALRLVSNDSGVTRKPPG